MPTAQTHDVLELIARAKLASLNEVRQAAGYQFDFDAQRRGRRGNTAQTGKTLAVLDMFGALPVPQTSQDSSGWIQMFGVDIFADPAEDLTDPVDTELNALIAAATKAMFGTVAARTCGGIALDEENTRIISVKRFTGTIQGVQILFSVHYETAFNDPLTPSHTIY